MNIYIRLYNGRNYPDEELDDWGSEGPIFGPYESAQWTYSTHIKLVSESKVDFLNIIGDYIFYNNVYYGDCIIFNGIADKEKLLLEIYDEEKAAYKER